MANTKVFPPLDHLNDIPGYLAAREAAEKLDLLAAYETREVEEFVAANPQYHATPFNAGLIRAWLALYDAIYSRWNLEICYRDLRDDCLLESAPAPVSAEVDAGNASITLTVTDALAEYRPGSQEAAALEELRDDPNLSDHARKNRDQRLRLLAGQQRRERSNLPPHYGQRPVL